jgi:hypothetical protein
MRLKISANGPAAPWFGNSMSLHLFVRELLKGRYNWAWEESVPCNAHNHPASCDCGWGGVWYGNVPYGGGARTFRCEDEQDSSSPRAVSIDRLVEADSPQSLTIPNAKCPVCGCRVFFYQNEYGSRVFFDDLGPPWPKHRCTDNSWYASPASGKIVATNLEAERARRKVRVGEWRPCVIYRKNGPRPILKELGSEKFVRLELSPAMLSSVLPIVYIREVSKRVLRCHSACNFDPLSRGIGVQN